MWSAIFLRITPIFSMRTLSPGLNAGGTGVAGAGAGRIAAAGAGADAAAGAAPAPPPAAAPPPPPSTNARMSFFVTRPDRPVPVRVVMSTPWAFAIVRTSGEDRVRRRSARVAGPEGGGTGTGAAVTGAGAGDAGAPFAAFDVGPAVGAAPVRARGWSPAAPITATTLLTGTVSPSLTLISSSTTAPGAGISASTLSVEISNSGSSLSI